MALEEPLGRGHALDPDDPLRLGVVLDDPVDEQERPAMRDQRLDLAGRVDGAGGERAAVPWAASVTVSSGAVSVGDGRHAGRCVQVCTHVGARPSRPRGGREERRAADAVEQVRGHPSLEERLAREQRPVDRDVRDDALDEQLVERDAAAGDRGRRGSGPRRSACRAVSRRTAAPRSRSTGASPCARPGRPAAGSARRRPAPGRKSCAGSSALIRNSIAWPRTSMSAWLKPERLAGGDPDLESRRGRCR